MQFLWLLANDRVHSAEGFSIATVDSDRPRYFYDLRLTNPLSVPSCQQQQQSATVALQPCTASGRLTRDSFSLVVT